MTPGITITSEPHAGEEETSVIRDAADEFNMSVTGDRNYSPVALFLRDSSWAIMGGLLGNIWGGWLHITFLWVMESLGGQGYGNCLVQMAEEEARAKGCRGAYLETYSFQAHPFYERFGYHVIVELTD